jgi:endonuclease I
MKRLFFFQLYMLLVFTVLAQIPTGYYDSAIGKKQAELKTALHLKIKTANVPSYGSGSGSTWSVFAKSDVRPEDGTVWDMYSNNHVAFNGNSAASGMNIEHSFAKSWWGDGRQAAQDVQHLCPSNTTANSAKGSWPMAVVDGSTTYSNGVIKVGKSSSRPGGVIDAWEPADDYKGDFARMYMYMVTAYEDYATLWTGNSVNQLDNNTYPVFEQWTVDLLLKWNAQDPLSLKEITRHNEVYKVQGNRNPYIDYPILGEYIWGKFTNLPFDPNGNTTTPYLTSPINATTLDLGKMVYQQTKNIEVTIKGANLTGELALSISGTNASLFSVSKTTLTKTEAETGYVLTLTYNTQTIGTHTAQLLISGGGISPTTLNLSAQTTDNFMALAATNITSNSFTAKWTSSATATGYDFNVYSLKSSGSTQTKTLLEEEFASGLPTSWLSEGYTDNQTTGFMRIASSSSNGKLTTPALNLATDGNLLTVRAKQYNTDTGAPLTVTLDGNPLALWNTGSTAQIYTVNIPKVTTNSKIAFAANASSRVYLDYVKVETVGAVQTEISVSGYPKNVGNILQYEVSGLLPDSSYYYTVSPQNNSSIKTDPVLVKTLLANALPNLNGKTVSWSKSSNGVFLTGLPHSCKILVSDISGKRITTILSEKENTILNLSTKGVYIIQILTSNNSVSLKVVY